MKSVKKTEDQYAERWQGQKHQEPRVRYWVQIQKESEKSYRTRNQSHKTFL